jgi:penicillin amidase
MSDLLDQFRHRAAEASFPERGRLDVTGIERPVTIARDRWGVPAIHAETLDDLWFSHGLVTGGERLFQLDLTLRAANGRLSEVFGESTVDDDRFARTIGFTRAGRRYVDGWTEVDHVMHDRFRAGVFAWIETMPAKPIEYELLDLEPALPVDAPSWAAAFAYLGWALSSNWDAEILRASIRARAGDDAVARLIPPVPSAPASVAIGEQNGGRVDMLPRARGQGSNAWAVAPSLTATGGPLLANDPHLLAVQPAVWLELHLSAPGYRARGVALTFTPGVLLGATGHHAWGVTNVGGDVQDLYIERLSEDGHAALYDDAWEPLAVHDEPIAVRGEREPRAHVVRETRHGPIVEARPVGRLRPAYAELPVAETYSLAWAGREQGIRPSLVLRAARASSFDEFRRVALEVTSPGQNFVYADVDGTIGAQCTGRYPVRRNGDGTIPAPGWTSDHGWQGWIPNEELPWSVDPAPGFVVSANHRMHDGTYPHLISMDFHLPFRAERISGLLSDRDEHDVASMCRIQLDTVSLPARSLLHRLRALRPADELQRAALDMLNEWDGDLAAGSGAAAVLCTWVTWIGRRALEPVLGGDLTETYLEWRERWVGAGLPALLDDPDGWADEELLRAALADALGELRERLGKDPAAWTWGALHPLTLASPLASVPGLEPLFTAAEVPFGGDEHTVCQAAIDGALGYRAAVVPSWRAVYDLADLDRSVGVLPAGVSGNPGSPHWNDQSELYANGKTKPLPFSDEALEAATVAVLSMAPAEPLPS